ncbi:hypothetical protein [Pelosinus baikalensis]|uniref:Uncharacterized protein n=1 Tax=Pelosinus baikalensis TaxID=2892015 RepID=A0ABS8HWW3_9FIRM|nr:hypothetical protein [Pelosinus baikalensis]MCC5467643.1 hypothetical protein [Pelosinus baikalensis]
MFIEIKSLDGTTFTVGGKFEIGTINKVLSVDSISFNSNNDNGQITYNVQCSAEGNEDEKYQYTIINPTYIARKL